MWLSWIFFRVKDENWIYWSVCFEDCTVLQQEEILHNLSDRKIKWLCIAMARLVKRISNTNSSDN